MAKPNINQINSINAKLEAAQMHLEALDGESATNADDIALLQSDKANVAQPAWSEATLQNNFTGSVKYRKNSIGQLCILINVTVGSTTAADTVVATLPANYRPDYFTPISLMLSTGATVNFRITAASGNINTIASSTTGQVITGSAVINLVN